MLPYAMPWMMTNECWNVESGSGWNDESMSKNEDIRRINEQWNA